MYKQSDPRESKQEEKSNEEEEVVDVKNKGKLFKGTPFLRGNTEDKLKITDLEENLEKNNQEVLLLKLEKRSL